jgi:ABC-2 type transport system permease protein
MQYSDILWGEKIGNDFVHKIQYILGGIGTRGLTITKMTIKRLLFSRKTIVLLFLCALPILISIYWLTTETGNGYTFFSDLVFLTYLFFIVVIISLLYGVSLFNDDITDKTITYLISRPVDRFELVIYKYIGYLFSAIVVVIPPLVLTFLIVAAKAGDIGGHIGLLSTYIGVFVLAIIGYGAIFMFFGLLFKRPLLISFIFMFVWEEFFASIPLLINKITLRHYLESICYHAINIGIAKEIFAHPDKIPADTIVSVVGLLIVGLFFLISAGIVGRSKDFA